MYHNSSDHNCSVFHRRGLVGDLLIHYIYKFLILIPVADLKMTQRFTVITRRGKRLLLFFTVEPPSSGELVGSICTDVQHMKKRNKIKEACSGVSHFTRAALQQSRSNLFLARQIFSYITGKQQQPRTLKTDQK